MEPREISGFSDTAISIIWNDGHQSIYLYEDLRQSCPCAKCNEIRKSSQKIIPFNRILPVNIDNPDIKPRKIEPVGNYAIRFYWSDRHSTGIYTFKFLRELCPCDNCTGSLPA